MESIYICTGMQHEEHTHTHARTRRVYVQYLYELIQLYCVTIHHSHTLRSYAYTIFRNEDFSKCEYKFVY